MSALPLPTQTLYSELLERLLAESARRTIGRAPGTFTTKTVKEETYVYFQYSEPGGRTRQLYLGKKSPAVERLVERFRSERVEESRERADLERLCAQVLAGGGWSMGHAPARVLRAFADAGVFDAGAVLVGTHAFGVMGNMLGMRWEGAHLRTEDLDLAAISVLAAPESERVDAPKALERLRMGFLPVPGLDPRSPSTSFKVRGRALRVDFLTPGTGSKPAYLARLGTYGHPLPFLDFLLENPEKAGVLDAGGFLVLVPAPARFALHKLIVSGERAVGFEAKAAKDLAQAAQLLEHLASGRPGDLRLASDALQARGWGGRLAAGWRRLASAHPNVGPAASLLGL